MTRTIFATILISAFLTSGCAAQKNNNPGNNSSSNAANVKTEKADVKSSGELEKQFLQIAAEAKGRVGVRAEILETGETASLNADEKFPMQSVYKLPIGMAVLKQVDDGKLKLDWKFRVEKTDFVPQGMLSPLRDENPNGTEVSLEELLRLAVSVSDGTASDVLMKLAGGAPAVQAYLDALKIGGITILNTEKEFGTDWETQYKNSATPAGAVELLRAVQEKRGLCAESNALLVKFLTETKTKPNRLKGLLPKDAIVAHKTGSGGSRGGITSATNDIGIVTLPNGKHLLIAVFVSDSPADENAREAVIAKIAKAAWDKWGAIKN